MDFFYRQESGLRKEELAQSSPVNMAGASVQVQTIGWLLLSGQ